MKVRVGYGVGAGPRMASEPGAFGALVDDLERLKYDSVWFAERVNSPQFDPTVAMAYVAGRTERIKFGSSVMVLPGRNPVLLAKAIASLDVVSGGRCLPAFGLGTGNTAEHQAFGVERGERAAWLNEALPLMRRLWSEDRVDHHGDRFSITGAEVLPKPLQQPLEVWLGGAAPSELRRCGRLSDGWLASFTTPAVVEAGIAIVQEAARDAGRTVDPEHFGVLIPYVAGELPDRVRELAQTRQPDADPNDVIATSHQRIATLINEYVSVGASKFVIFPFAEPADSSFELAALAEVVLPLQT